MDIVVVVPTVVHPVKRPPRPAPHASVRVSIGDDSDEDERAHEYCHGVEHVTSFSSARIIVINQSDVKFFVDFLCRL